MGGTILFEGECSGVECAENCGYRMMVERSRRVQANLWVEVVPFNEGYNYYLTLVEKRP